jgi:DNA uptake protein ComE-like DNA-binding protein
VKSGFRRRQSGLIMVQALVLIAGLLALMAVLAANQRVTLNATQNQLRQRRAEVAARSAIAIALATLQEANPNLVTLADEWAILGDNGNQAFEIGTTGTTYRMQILDAGSLLNLNTATETQLQQLPLTPEQLDSLLDWREATGQGRPQGAKDEYYNTLTQPYNAKLGRIVTRNEVLLIRGWTAKAFYNPPAEDTVTTATPARDAEGNLLPIVDLVTADSGMPNTRADGQARTNISQGNLNQAALIQLGVDPNLAQQIVARGPYSSWAELFALPGLSSIALQGLLDEVTITPTNRLEGKVNINTASQGVLESLLQLTPDVASAIVSRQSVGFASLGDIATIPGITSVNLAQIADSIGVGSDTWIVRAYGESGGVGVAVEAVIGLRNGRAQIITYERLNNTNIPTWWNWEPEALETLPAGSASGSMTGGGSAGSAGGTGTGGTSE